MKMRNEEERSQLAQQILGTSVQQQSQAPAIRVDGKVMASLLVRRTNPVYPPLAKQSRIQGTVMLEVTIGADGNVINVKQPAGPSYLTAGQDTLKMAAAECIKQWQYQPYMLNGQPAPVITQVPVVFSLAQAQ
jgi:periplasmic protein TonB